MNQNIDLIVILTIFGAVIVYMIFGFIIVKYIYGEKIEKSLLKENNFTAEAAGIEEGLCIVGWVIILPYDLITKFKRFKE